jgi:hypothetical protein
MDTLVIILIIVIIVLIYFLYRTSKKASTNNKTTLYNLNTNTATVNSADLTNPKSQRFSYSAWIFVNSWNNTIQKNIYKNSSGLISLDLAASIPTLSTRIGTSPTPTDITITQNFPIQKWVYVVISVDSQTVDCYLDGKLLKSTQLSVPPTLSDNYSISFGKFDAYVTGFKYEATPLNPQQVWSNYMAGNGYAGGKFGVNVALTKDDAVVSQISY